MVTITSLLLISNNFYEEKRAKRSGRNPATGAFVAMSRSGIVDLNHCINFGHYPLCVHLPDRTGYGRLAPTNTPHVNPWNSSTTLVVNIDSDDISKSSCDIINSINSAYTAIFNEVDGDFIIYNVGTAELYIDSDTTDLVKIVINGKEYTYCVIKCHYNGNLYFSGIDVATTEDEQVELGVNIND